MLTLPFALTTPIRGCVAGGLGSLENIRIRRVVYDGVDGRGHGA